MSGSSFGRGSCYTSCVFPWRDRRDSTQPKPTGSGRMFFCSSRIISWQRSVSSPNRTCVLLCFFLTLIPALDGLHFSRWVHKKHYAPFFTGGKFVEKESEWKGLCCTPWSCEKSCGKLSLIFFLIHSIRTAHHLGADRIYCESVCHRYNRAIWCCFWQ